MTEIIGECRRIHLFLYEKGMLMKINFDQTVQTNGSQEPSHRVRRQQAGRSQRGYGAYVDGRDSIHPGNALGSRWNQKQKGRQPREKPWRIFRSRPALRMCR